MASSPTPATVYLPFIASKTTNKNDSRGASMTHILLLNYSKGVGQ